MGVAEEVTPPEQRLAPTDAHIKESPRAGKFQYLRGFGLPSPVGRFEVDALSPALAQSPVLVADSQVCISVFQRNKESQSSPLSGFRDGPMADHQ